MREAEVPEGSEGSEVHNEGTKLTETNRRDGGLEAASRGPEAAISPFVFDTFVPSL